MLCKFVRRFRVTPFLAVFCVLIGNKTLAQEPSAAPAPERGVVYHSDVDDLMTVEKVSVLPFTDNLQGIYARPLEAHFISLIDKMHRWDYVPATNSGPILSPEELEASPEKVLQASQGLGVDALFSARVSKGPGGVAIHLSLFLTKDGKLLAQAILKDHKQFDLPDLKEQMQKLLGDIIAHMPYSGRVLSREGNRVTVNLGSLDSLQKDQVLSVIQLVQAQRHPKFNFLVRTEKEIVGKIKVLKVDENLSFGVVVSEREKGAIQKNAKIGALDFVHYSDSDSLSLTPSGEEALTQREDSNMVYGKNAHAWSPQSPATFGQIGARLGLNKFNGNTEVSGGVGGLASSTNFAPSVLLEGEIWVTPEWTFRARLKQGLVAVDNPRSGSTPGQLNQSLSYYEAVAGYTIRFGPYIYSPFAEPFFGYFNYKLFTDNAAPEAFTTMQYSGFKFGVRGAVPLGDRAEYGVGGELSMAWHPGLSESPVTSGASSTNNVTQFGIFGYQRWGERLKVQVNLDFEMYSSTFSGNGTRANAATSASQRYTTLSGGLYYMF